MRKFSVVFLLLVGSSELLEANVHRDPGITSMITGLMRELISVIGLYPGAGGLQYACVIPGKGVCAVCRCMKGCWLIRSEGGNTI